MSIKLLVRQGGAAADQPDLANIASPIREGVPIFDGDTPLVEMAQRWEQGTAGRGQFTHVDRAATLTYKFRPHAEVELIEDESGNDYIIAWGRIEGGNDVGRRTPTGIGGDEVQHNSVQVMDCNIDLRGLPFRNGWSRPAETSWERLQALELAKLNGSSSTETLRRATTDIRIENFANNHLVDASDPIDLDAVDYPPGTFVEEIMADIMEQWGKGWGVTIHHQSGASHKCLLVQDMDDLATFTSALRISDQMDDWDPTHATAPVLEPVWRRANGKTSDNSATISGLISIWGGEVDDPRHLYVETGEAPEDWETWVDVYHDDLARNETQADRRANHVLNDRKRPYISHQPSILLRPEQVTLITAGQSIETKSVVLNQGPDKHDYVWRRIVEIAWEPEPNGNWWAHLSLERPRNTHPRAGGPSGPGPGTPTGGPPPPCAEVPDDVVTTLSDSAVGDWGSTVTTGSCWGGDPHRSIGGSGQLSPAVSVTAGDVIVGAVNFRDETGNDTWENVTNYNYHAALQFFGTALPMLEYEIVNTRYHLAGCINVNHSTTQTVPSGYTTARIKVFSRLGGYQFNGTISSVDAADVPESDPDCVEGGAGGTNPYPPRYDDPRFDADDQHLTTMLQERVVNNSGGVLAAGDIVIPDITQDDPSVTTTTTAATTDARVGVMMADVADGETGVVLWEGAITDVVVNDGAATSADGDYIYTSTTAGAASVSGTRTTGAVGRIIRDDAGDPAYVLWWGVPDSGGGGGGGHDITEDGGAASTTRANLDFRHGLDVTDDSGTDSTRVAVDESELDHGTLGGLTDVADHPQYQTAALEITIGDGTAAIVTGVCGYVRVPFACQIVRNTLLSKTTAASIVVDVWLDTYANFPPVVGDTITASAKPTLSSAQKSEYSTLTGWTTALPEGSVLGFNVDSVSGGPTQVTLELKVTRA